MSIFGKMIVKRSSNWDSPVSPCEKAVRESLLYSDIRTVDDPKKNLSIRDWYAHGSNHRLVPSFGKSGSPDKNWIARDFPTEEWTITLNTLEELEDFIKKYGQVVIELSPYFNPPIGVIEIYDDYRE